ncbi:hypothetical protein LCGC14_2657130, partial [marine sediment metagenome]
KINNKCKSTKTAFTLWALFALSLTSFAQDSLTVDQPETEERLKFFQTPYKYNNIPKINVIALGVGNISLLYERAIYKKLSATMGIGYKFGGTSPALFTPDDGNNSMKIQLSPIKAITLTPEFRYYLGRVKKDAPGGFYSGLYFRYSNFWTDAYFEHTASDNSISRINSDLSLTEFGFGVQLGYQLIIKDRFTIDFMFLGPRLSFFTITNEFSGEVTEEFRQDFEKVVQDVIDRLGSDYNFSVGDVEGNTLKGKMRIPGLRFGVSVGYAF